MPSLKDWGSQVKHKGGGDGGRYISNKKWKEDGQLIFWVHPETMFADRDIIMLPVKHTTEDNEKKIHWVRRFFSGEDDVAQKVLDWLIQADDIDEDDVVFRLKHGKEKQQYTKGEILGLKGYGFMGKVLNARTESLSSIVAHHDPANKILAVPISAGKKIWKRIESQMKDNGEEGNPQLHPYPLKVTFDEKAKRGSDYYDADVVLMPGGLPDEIAALFELDPHDIETECDPSNEDTDDFGTTVEILAAMCVVDCPILNDAESVEDEDEGEEDDAEDEDETEDDDEDESDDEDDDDEGIDSIEAGEAEKGGSYLLEDDTEVTFSGVKSRKAVFKDEDGKQHKLALDDDVWPVVDDGDEDDDDEETDDEDGEILVKNAKPGVWYIDSDGDSVKFLKYDSDAEVGMVEDEEGDPFNMDADDTLKKK